MGEIDEPTVPASGVVRCSAQMVRNHTGNVPAPKWKGETLQLRESLKSFKEPAEKDLLCFDQHIGHEAKDRMSPTKAAGDVPSSSPLGELRWGQLLNASHSRFRKSSASWTMKSGFRISRRAKDIRLGTQTLSFLIVR